MLCRGLFTLLQVAAVDLMRKALPLTSSQEGACRSLMWFMLSQF